jgi:hypothetical protein
MTTFDIAILGAGFAGLVCARQLAAKGFSVLVVEVRPSALELAARAGPIDRSDSLLTRTSLSPRRAGTELAVAHGRTSTEATRLSILAAAGSTASSRARPSARSSRASASCVLARSSSRASCRTSAHQPRRDAAKPDPLASPLSFSNLTGNPRSQADRLACHRSEWYVAARVSASN